MFSQPSGAFRFGPFLLDCSEHALTRDGVTIPLTPKAFATLRVLVENAGHLVTKKDLLNQVWGETFVEESTLSQNVFTLRKALGTSPDGHPYIETVPKLGFRFVASVEVAPSGNGSGGRRTEAELATLPPANEQGPEASDSSLEAGVSGGQIDAESVGHGARRWLAAGALGLLLVVAGLLALPWTTEQQAAPVVVSRPRPIAVLPFRNLKPDPKWDYLGPALAQLITDRLSDESQMFSRPRFSELPYRHASDRLEEMARELDVEVIMAGSYLVEGNSIWLSAEVVDAAARKPLWKGHLTFDSTESIAPEAAVVEKLREVLRLEGGNPTLERSRPSRIAKNARAYESYLRGLDASVQGRHREARQFYREALRLDPEFGPALAWLAMETVGAAYGAQESEAADPRFLQEGVELSQRAIQKGVLSPALLSSTGLYLMELGQLEAALTHLRRAVEMNPNYPEAHLWLSQAYRYAGFLDKSRAEAESALALDPSLREFSTLNTYLYLGELDRFLESMPQSKLSARSLFYKGLAYYSRGDFVRAEAEFTRAQEMEPRLIHAQYGQAFLLSMRGRQAEARMLLQGLEEARQRDGEMLYKLAQGYVVAGDPAGAVRVLGQAVRSGFFCHECFVRDPILKPLGSRADFGLILQKARERQAAIQKKSF